MGNGTCSYFRSDVYFRSRLDPQSRSRGINRHRRGKKESPRRAIGRDRDIFPPQFCSDLAVETLSWTPYWIISAVNFIFAHEWSCQLPCHHKSISFFSLCMSHRSNSFHMARLLRQTANTYAQHCSKFYTVRGDELKQQ